MNNSRVAATCSGARRRVRGLTPLAARRGYTVVRAGLTLVELLVVLVILAVLTTIAVQATSGLADQARFEATQRTLQNVQNAVGVAGPAGNDNNATVAGFVADMGRLPMTRLEDRGALGKVLTLNELWLAPSDPALLFGFKPAPVPDNDVLIPCGWRGPYLQLAAGTSRLLDGWGTELVTPLDQVAQAKDFPYSCLRDASDQAVSTPNQAIAIVRSPGQNRTVNPLDTNYDADADVRFPATGYQASVLGTVEISLVVTVLDKDNNAVADPAKIKDATDRTKNALTGGLVVAKVFGPDPVGGQVAVFQSAAMPLAASQASFLVQTNGPSALTAGPRILRAYCTSLTFSAPSDLTITPTTPALGLQVPLNVRPGANVVPRVFVPVNVTAKFNI